MTASVVLALMASIGTLITSIQAFLTRRFRRSLPPFVPGPRFPRAASFVSILKPVCGLDDGLEENLLSFARLRGIRYEVLVSAEEWTDPAVEVARRVMRQHPDAPFRLIVEGGSGGGVVNRKVERLIAAARAATGSILFISDSNVRVEPDDIARTVDLFGDPRAGCVSNLFTGSGAGNKGATLESLHLLSFVATGAVLAATAGVPCVVGKSMALRREALEAIGGFERFRNVLAEDQAIGLAMRAAGFEVVLSPVVVRNVIARRTLRRAAERQVRWNKIRFAFSPLLYAGELLLNPLPFAIAASVLAPGLLAPLPVVVILTRVLQLELLNRSLTASMTSRQIALVPLLDLMMLCTWMTPFFSRQITWRGYRARIGRNTEMAAA